MIPLWFRRDIHLGDTGADVRVVRRKVGLTDDGPYDRATQMRVIGLSRARKIKTAGEVNEAVAEELGASESEKAGLLPEWFTREKPIELWDSGDDVLAVRSLLGLPTHDNRYEPDTEAAVLRFQSERGLPLTGQVGEPEARLLGEV